MSDLPREMLLDGPVALLIEQSLCKDMGFALCSESGLLLVKVTVGHTSLTRSAQMASAYEQQRSTLVSASVVSVGERV